MNAASFHFLRSLYLLHPTDLRLQVQIARALANMTSVRNDATITCLMSSGFFTDLLYWAKHALDEPQTLEQKQQEEQQQTKKRKHNVNPDFDDTNERNNDEDEPELHDHSDHETPVPVFEGGELPAMRRLSSSKKPSTKHASIEPAVPSPNTTSDSPPALRNRLQAQSLRALWNLRSITEMKHGGEGQGLCAEEVFPLYAFFDTLQSNSNVKISENLPARFIKSPSNSSAASSPEVDIVFIHGLLGNALRTWRLHTQNDRGGRIEEQDIVTETISQAAHIVEHAVEATAAAVSDTVVQASHLVTDQIIPAVTGTTSSDHSAESKPTTTKASSTKPSQTKAHRSRSISPVPKPVLDAVGDTITITHTPDEPTVEKHLEIIWPRDWLPQDINNCRIFTLGYSSTLSLK